uniref:Uncharacterized protein n=1 Tax=Arundo donax TaxID=35708 RepID=A0A0A8YE05_ARUDO
MCFFRCVKSLLKCLSTTTQEALLEFTSWIMTTFAGDPGDTLRVTVIPTLRSSSASWRSLTW